MEDIGRLCVEESNSRTYPHNYSRIVDMINNIQSSDIDQGVIPVDQYHVTVFEYAVIHGMIDVAVALLDCPFANITHISENKEYWIEPEIISCRMPDEAIHKVLQIRSDAGINVPVVSENSNAWYRTDYLSSAIELIKPKTADFLIEHGFKVLKHHAEKIVNCRLWGLYWKHVHPIKTSFDCTALLFIFQDSFAKANCNYCGINFPSSLEPSDLAVLDDLLTVVNPFIPTLSGNTTLLMHLMYITISDIIRHQVFDKYLAMIDESTDLDCQNYCGMTAFIYATRNASLSIVKKLVETGKTDIYHQFLGQNALSRLTDEHSTVRDYLVELGVPELQVDLNINIVPPIDENALFQLPPYTQEELEQFENLNGIQLENSLRKHLLTVSRDYDIRYALSFDIYQRKSFAQFNTYHSRDIPKSDEIYYYLQHTKLNNYAINKHELARAYTLMCLVHPELPKGDFFKLCCTECHTTFDGKYHNNLYAKLMYKAYKSGEYTKKEYKYLKTMFPCDWQLKHRINNQPLSQQENSENRCECDGLWKIGNHGCTVWVYYVPTGMYTGAIIDQLMYGNWSFVDDGIYANIDSYFRDRNTTIEIDNDSDSDTNRSTTTDESESETETENP